MSITSANASLTLSILPLFPIPQQLQGFATDDIYDIPRIKSVEAQMGVDGIASFGFTFVLIPQEITLQADSLSNRIFDTWWLSMQAAREVYLAYGVMALPGVSTKFAQVRGGLTGYSPAPGAGRVLKPRKYEITWQTVVPAPV